MTQPRRFADDLLCPRSAIRIGGLRLVFTLTVGGIEALVCMSKGPPVLFGLKKRCRLGYIHPMERNLKISQVLELVTMCITCHLEIEEADFDMNNKSMIY